MADLRGLALFPRRSLRQRQVSQWPRQLHHSTGVRNAAGATSCFVERDAKFHYPDFDISTTYKFTPEKMAYARIGRGHRSGGFTLGFRQLVHLQPFAEEQVTEGELG